MNLIYRPRSYNGPFPVGNCTSCNSETTCKGIHGNFFCSVCQYYHSMRAKDKKVAA